MWRVVVVLNMHTKFREKWSATILCRKDEDYFCQIKDNSNLPHNNFHRFLFLFSNKFPDQNFAPYVLYITHAMKHVLDTNSEPGLPLVLHQLVHRRFPNNSKLKNN